jgi:hypothetical protein
MRLWLQKLLTGFLVDCNFVSALQTLISIVNYQNILVINFGPLYL